MQVRYDVTLLTDQDLYLDLYLFNEGSHFRLYEKLGDFPAVWRDPTTPQRAQADARAPDRGRHLDQATPDLIGHLDEVIQAVNRALRRMLTRGRPAIRQG